MISLCGDLWDYPERFKTDGLLIWPVYLSISVDEWQKWGLEEYAKQSGSVASETLMINPIDHDPQNHGGSCYFREGELMEKTAYDEEEILLVEI